MKNPLIFVYLIVAGLLLLVIGGAILIAPHAFHGSNGIQLGDNPNLMSEIRAPGGLLLTSGVLILLGAIKARLRVLALQISLLVYGTFGVARLVSVALDGLPSSSILGAAALEIVFALVALILLWRNRAPKKHAFEPGPANAYVAR